jgi:5-methylcytosine-specific restriction enzyme A
VTRPSSSEFDDKTKAFAFAQCGARCALCTRALKASEARYDHILPVGLQGKPTLANCQVLCVGCHAVKTGTEDIPAIRRADRLAKKRAGFKVKGAKGGKRNRPPAAGVSEIARKFQCFSPKEVQ